MGRIFNAMLTILWLFPVAVAADEVKVVYMTATTADGKSVEARLVEADGVTLPRLYMADNTLKINSVVYHRDEITSLRFDIRTETIDAINSVSADESTSDRGAVYSVSGRLVRSGSTSTEGLPKGVYIINKKKVVVR